VTYLCAGLYAEGPTDYAFLLPLLDQLLPQIAVEALPEIPIIGPSVGIDAGPRAPARRDARIAAAIRAHWDQCTLFVIHADGAGDPHRALREQVEPGLSAVRTEHPDLAAVACVPVREIEAWLLADGAPFRKLFPSATALALPDQPEGLIDPKRTLREVLTSSGGSALRGLDVFDFFGANVNPAELRRLPAFRKFEEELVAAIRAAARP
jgi:hypothetical protein